MNEHLELYHYTSREVLPLILREGIDRGDVPTTPTGGFNAPWLTGDTDWGEQNWTTNSAYNKRAVRLMVLVSSSDPLLCKWSKVAKDHKIDNKFFKALNHGNNSNKWFIYQGIISPKMISKIEYSPFLPNIEDIALELAEQMRQNTLGCSLKNTKKK